MIGIPKDLSHISILTVNLKFVSNETEADGEYDDNDDEVS